MQRSDIRRWQVNRVEPLQSPFAGCLRKVFEILAERTGGQLVDALKRASGEMACLSLPGGLLLRHARCDRKCGEAQYDESSTNELDPGGSHADSETEQRRAVYCIGLCSHRNLGLGAHFRHHSALKSLECKQLVTAFCCKTKPFGDFENRCLHRPGCSSGRCPCLPDSPLAGRFGWSGSLPLSAGFHRGLPTLARLEPGGLIALDPRVSA